MRAKYWYLGIATTVAAAGTLWLWQPWQALDHPVADQQGTETANGETKAPPTMVTADITSTGKTAKSQSLAPISPAQASAELAQVNIPGTTLPAHAYAQNRRQMFMQFWNQALTWTVNEFRNRRQRAETLSGEESYQVYVYLRTCLSAPRNDADLNQRKRNIERVMNNSEAFAKDWATDSIARAEAGLVRCQGLQGELNLAALQWLTLAAEQGYPLAQIAYYQSARWLLTVPMSLVFRYPEQVFGYRRMAPELLQAAITSGHAEAFVEFALALHDGIVFPRDPLAALGYAHAADLASHGQITLAAEHLQTIQDELSAGDIRQARAMGRRLCDQYCR